jgi:hypothetical protein
MGFSFNDLNLSNVTVTSAPRTLRPGRYAVEVKEAELTPTRNGGTQLKCRLVDKASNDSILHWIPLHNPNSEINQRIGREQFKAMLVHGGHNNPDEPGDIKTVNGLVVGVSIGTDSYMKDGEQREGSKVKGFFPAADINPKYGSAAPAASSSEAPNDDIPF